MLCAILKENGIQLNVEQALQAYGATEPIWAELTAELPQTVLWPDEIFEQLDILLLQQLRIPGDIVELARLIRQSWNQMDRQLPQPQLRTAYPDAIPCLEAIRNLGLKMGIVSNIPSEDWLRRELEIIGLVKYFQILVSSGSIGIAKPDRRIFKIAAEKIQTKPPDILFVGDDPQRDYHGATEAGMKALLVDRKELFTRTKMRRVSSLEELPKILETI